MAGHAPKVMNSENFKNRTTFLMARGRKELEVIDTDLLLAEYAVRAGYRDVTITRLAKLLVECKKWLDLKQNKDTRNANKRRDVVHELAGQVFARLQYETFEQNKANGARNNLRELQGVYKHEAASKAKGVPRLGATPLHGAAITPEWLAERNLVWQNLTQQQYEQLEALAEKKGDEGGGLSSYLPYFSKDQRMGYLLVVLNGRFLQQSFTPYDTKALQGQKSIYAVDKYGNFFVEKAGGSVPNHSCFCRGLGVICAGEIKVSAGVPTYINNGSGHYQPTVQELKEAVKLLEDHGFNLNAITVEDWSVPKRTRTWNSARRFLQGFAPDQVT